jgi:hypothetical protein
MGGKKPNSLTRHTFSAIFPGIASEVSGLHIADLSVVLLHYSHTLLTMNG